MSTQTIEREKVEHIMGDLSDSALEKLASYAAFLRHEEAQREWVPNAETIAAMKEAESGNLKSFSSIEELMADLHADDPED